MEKHFVTFFSPGTFVHETTSKPIDAWDITKAVAMSREIVERYDARPFGFQFTTRTRGADDLDSHVSATSPMYYLGGKVRTLAQVEADADPKEGILRCNMRSNHIARVVTMDTPWRSTHPLNDGDVVVQP